MKWGDTQNLLSVITCKEIRLPRLMKVKDDAATLKKAAPDLLANAQSPSADPKKIRGRPMQKNRRVHPSSSCDGGTCFETVGGAPQVG
jgi:hypothetical protein